jgi:hypothetical protein
LRLGGRGCSRSRVGDSRDGGVGELDQVEAVHDDLCLRRSVGDGAPVGCARIDRDELDPLPELFGLGR